MPGTFRRSDGGKEYQRSSVPTRRGKMERSRSRILEVLREKLDFYHNFRTELWLLMCKYDDTENLKRELHRIDGKIEVLKELLERLQ